MRYFIFGIIFATTLIPILDSITAIIITALEVIKGKLTIKITEYNKQIANADFEEEKTSIIGFSIPTEEDDYGED